MTRNSEVAQRVADRFKQGDTVLVTLEQFPSGIVFDRIQFLSRKHRLTAYDAAYLELALKNGLALATLGEALLREYKNAGFRWLDYEICFRLMLNAFAPRCLSAASEIQGLSTSQRDSPASPVGRSR